MQDPSSVCVSTTEFDDAVTAEEVSGDLQTEDFLFSLSTECVKGVRSVIIIHIAASHSYLALCYCLTLVSKLIRVSILSDSLPSIFTKVACYEYAVPHIN